MSEQETPANQGPSLQYHIVRWQGNLPDGRLIWMEDKVFQEYAYAWAIAKNQTQQPNLDQLIEARQHCRQISYWKDCKDPRVYIQPVLPGKRRDDTHS